MSNFLQRNSRGRHDHGTPGHLKSSLDAEWECPSDISGSSRSLKDASISSEWCCPGCQYRNVDARALFCSGCGYKRDASAVPGASDSSRWASSKSFGFPSRKPNGENPKRNGLRKTKSEDCSRSANCPSETSAKPRACSLKILPRSKKPERESSFGSIPGYNTGLPSREMPERKSSFGSIPGYNTSLPSREMPEPKSSFGSIPGYNTGLTSGDTRNGNRGLPSGPQSNALGPARGLGSATPSYTGSSGRQVYGSGANTVNNVTNANQNTAYNKMPPPPVSSPRQYNARAPSGPPPRDSRTDPVPEMTQASFCSSSSRDSSLTSYGGSSHTPVYDNPIAALGHIEEDKECNGPIPSVVNTATTLRSSKKSNCLELSISDFDFSPDELKPGQVSDDAMNMSFAAWTNEDKEAWTCSACTYINENPLHLTCELCGSSKPTSSTEKRRQEPVQPRILEEEEEGEEDIEDEVMKAIEKERMSELVREQFRMLEEIQTNPHIDDVCESDTAALIEDMNQSFAQIVSFHEAETYRCQGARVGARSVEPTSTRRPRPYSQDSQRRLLASNWQDDAERRESVIELLREQQESVLERMNQKLAHY